MTKEKIIKQIGLGFTVFGIFIIAIYGDFVIGFLAIIIGELVDLPYRLNSIQTINKK